MQALEHGHQKAVTAAAAKAQESGVSGYDIPNLIPPPPGASQKCRDCYYEKAALYLTLVGFCIDFAPDIQHCIDEVYDDYLEWLDDCPCGSA